MRTHNQLVAAAYDLFAPYTLGASLSVCKVCCVTDAEERELLATPLRQVSRDLLQNAYYESARDYSDQERWEMKHFLPRVLELVSGDEFPCHSLEIIFARLDLHLAQHWPAPEQRLLDDYALAYVERSLNRYSSPHPLPLADVLLMFGVAYFDLAPLLGAWLRADTPVSLQHFIDLLIDELRILSNGSVKLLNPFSEWQVNSQVAAWLGNQAVRAVWADRLERAVWQGELPDQEATRASWAYEVLTKGLADIVVPSLPPGTIVLP